MDTKDIRNDHKFFAEKLKYATEYGLNFDTRTIYVFNALTDEIGTNLRIKYDLIKQWWKNVECKDFNDITIDIASCGGDIYAITSALDFYDELKKYENVLVNTKAQTVCMSAATILLAGGTGERTCTSRTRFMLHDIQVEGMGGSAKQLQSAIMNLNEEQIDMFAFYAQFSNKNKTFTDKELKKEALKWIKKYTKDNIEHYLTADKMLELNLIDRIL